MNNRTLFLKKDKEESLKRFHPWIFSGAIQNIDEEVAEGDVVSVYSCDNRFLAKGHYQMGSIAVRILSFNEDEIDDDFWINSIQKAYNMRIAIGFGLNSKYTNAFRLIHGEGDNLPGLIVDIYGSTAVMQAHSVGMHCARMKIADAIKSVLGTNLKSIYYKSETTLPRNANLGAEDGFIYGDEQDNIAIENGLKFHVDLMGQKTGFFIDQRESRRLLESYSRGRSVLNMFCYTGGFSFYAMRGGAKLVHSVDSSAKAIEMAKNNVEINFPGDNRHETFVEEAFRYLSKSGDMYDLMILDPPAFAKRKDALVNALAGYRNLNASAISKIRSGGILLTFSCSQVVNRETFRTTIFSASARAGRKVRILEQLSQPADHPINIYHPEGEYLKGLVVYVE